MKTSSEYPSHSLVVAVVFCLANLTACSTPTYSRADGPSDQLADNTVRYGSIVGLGTVGFFDGKEIGQSNSAGAVGAGTGALLAYGANKFFDSKRKDAYHTGYNDGADAARAEIVNDTWNREAVYGLPDPNQSPPLPTYRQVYVPTRTLNGVQLQGEYQTVQILKY